MRGPKPRIRPCNSAMRSCAASSSSWGKSTPSLYVTKSRPTSSSEKNASRTSSNTDSTEASTAAIRSRDPNADSSDSTAPPDPVRLRWADMASWTSISAFSRRGIRSISSSYSPSWGSALPICSKAKRALSSSTASADSNSCRRTSSADASFAAERHARYAPNGALISSLPHSSSKAR